MRKLLSVVWIVLVVAKSVAAQWQWSAEVERYVSPETNAKPRAFLWIPDHCRQLRAVVIGQHNMCEETIFEHPLFRASLQQLGFGMLWISPGIDQPWDMTNGCQQLLEAALDTLAERSGYTELSHVPVVPLGHSAMATYPWNYAAWNPTRTLAVVSYCGDAPRTNLTGYGRNNIEWGRTRNIDGIPGLMIMSEQEWWEARVLPALAFRMMYPQSCISFLANVGHGHFDVSDEVVQYLALFLRKAVHYRLPAEGGLGDMRSIDPGQGWLAQRWQPQHTHRAQPAPVSAYQGDSHDAFWYYDQEMAMATENYYAAAKGRKASYIGFTMQGCLLSFSPQEHYQYKVVLDMLDDSLRFTLKGVYTDSLRQYRVSAMGASRISVDRICGPVCKIDDTTFAVRFYHMGLDNPRRTSAIWLVASSPDNPTHKGTVQQLWLEVPYPQRQGVAQRIYFDSIGNMQRTAKPMVLQAKSDKGLPVFFYVKEGPIKIEGTRLVITPIPPRAKYPIKATVVAWQYGRTTGNKIQTAQAIERTFYIE